MNKKTVEKLNKLNKDFYEKISPFFDKTRNYYWKGWEHLIPLIKQRFPQTEELRVLDVGCGNGRFGSFLKEQLKTPTIYTGIDSNSYLLQKAQEKLSEATFIKSDFLKLDYASLEPSFDLIAIFGVLHHIPGYENRRQLLRNLKNLLSAKSLLVFSIWNFLQSPSLKKRVQPWSTISLENQVEENDYLLDWKKGVQSLRYCHIFTNEEINSLCSESSLKILKTYSSSASGDRYNKYFVLS